MGSLRRFQAIWGVNFWAISLIGAVTFYLDSGIILYHKRGVLREREVGLMDVERRWQEADDIEEAVSLWEKEWGRAANIIRREWIGRQWKLSNRRPRATTTSRVFRGKERVAEEGLSGRASTLEELGRFDDDGRLRIRIWIGSKGWKGLCHKMRHVSMELR